MAVELSANSHVGSREFLLGRRGAAALLLSSPPAKSPHEKLFIHTVRKFYFKMGKASVTPTPVNQLVRRYVGNTFRFHGVGVSGPLQSVCRPRDVIYFMKAMTAFSLRF